MKSKTIHQKETERLYVMCTHLANKHNVLLRRSHISGEIHYQIYDKFCSSKSWRDVYNDLEVFEESHV